MSESREGFAVSNEEISALDNIISPLLKKGQSIHHIAVNHKDQIMVSESLQIKSQEEFLILTK